MAAFHKALAIDPELGDARFGLGEVLEDRGLFPEALAEYRTLLAKEPRHTGALYNVAIIQEIVAPAQAAEDWQRHIAVAEQLPTEREWVRLAQQHLRKVPGLGRDGT